MEDESNIRGQRKVFSCDACLRGLAEIDSENRPPALLGGRAAPRTERLTGGALLARDLLPPDLTCNVNMS